MIPFSDIPVTNILIPGSIAINSLFGLKEVLKYRFGTNNVYSPDLLSYLNVQSQSYFDCILSKLNVFLLCFPSINPRAFLLYLPIYCAIYHEFVFQYLHY